MTFVHGVGATVGSLVSTLCFSLFCSGVNDEFADFSSAFSEGVTVSSNTVGSSNQQFNSGTIGSTASIPSSNGIFGKNCFIYCSIVVVVLVVVNIQLLHLSVLIFIYLFFQVLVSLIQIYFLILEVSSRQFNQQR